MMLRPLMFCGGLIANRSGRAFVATTRAFATVGSQIPSVELHSEQLAKFHSYLPLLSVMKRNSLIDYIIPLIFYYGFHLMLSQKTFPPKKCELLFELICCNNMNSFIIVIYVSFLFQILFIYPINPATFRSIVKTKMLSSWVYQLLLLQPDRK